MPRSTSARRKTSSAAVTQEAKTSTTMGDITAAPAVVGLSTSVGAAPTETPGVRLLAFFFNMLTYVAFLGQGQNHVALVYALCSVTYWALHAGLRVDVPVKGGDKDDPRSYRRSGFLSFATLLFVQFLGGALNPVAPSASSVVLLFSLLLTFPLGLILQWTASKRWKVQVAFFLVWSLVKLLDLTFSGNFWLHVSLLQAYIVILMGSASRLRSQVAEGVRSQQKGKRGGASALPPKEVVGACLLEKVLANFTIPCTWSNTKRLLRHLLVFVLCVASMGVVVPSISRLSSSSSNSGGSTAETSGGDVSGVVVQPTWVVPWPWETATIQLTPEYFKAQEDLANSGKGKGKGVYLCTRSVENPVVAFLGGIHSVAVVNGQVWENYPDPTGTGIPLPDTVWVNASAGKSAKEKEQEESSTNKKNQEEENVNSDSIFNTLWPNAEPMKLLERLAVPPVEQLWGTDWNAVRTFPVASGADNRLWYRCQDMGTLLPKGTTAAQSQSMLLRLIARFVEKNERYNLVVKPSNCHNLAQEVLYHTAMKAPSTTPDVTTRFVVLFILLGIALIEADRIRFVVESVAC